MRALLFALLLATGCMSELQTHATIAVTARSLINEVGVAIDTQAESERQAAGGDNADAAHVVALEAKWAPVEQKYIDVEIAERSWLVAIAVAYAERGKKLDLDTPQKLIAAWQTLSLMGVEIGLKLPGPPAALVEIAGGAP